MTNGNIRILNRHEDNENNNGRWFKIYIYTETKIHKQKQRGYVIIWRKEYIHWKKYTNGHPRKVFTGAKWRRDSPGGGWFLSSPPLPLLAGRCHHSQLSLHLHHLKVGETNQGQEGGLQLQGRRRQFPWVHRSGDEIVRRHQWSSTGTQNKYLGLRFWRFGNNVVGKMMSVHNQIVVNCL